MPGLVENANVLVTDTAWDNVKVESDVLASIGARIAVAESADEETLFRLVPEADAVLTCFAQVTERVIRAGRKLRVISRYGVGTDNISVSTASELSIPVTNVASYCVDEVVEHVLALMLSMMRKIVPYVDSVRAGEWALAAGAPIHRIRGSVLGIVGLGTIGRALAARAMALGMNVVFARPPGRVIKDADWQMVSLEQLASMSDVVSIHVPLSEGTRRMFDATFFAQMKPTAYFINAARGGVVDSEALLGALSDGRIAGAGLDVLEVEPPASFDLLVSHPRVITTPHVAFYSEESLSTLAAHAARNVVEVLSGRLPTSIVNREALNSAEAPQSLRFSR